jgi:hypothetical protein
MHSGSQCGLHSIGVGPLARESFGDQTIEAIYARRAIGFGRTQAS